MRTKPEKDTDKALEKMAKDFCSWGKGGNKKKKSKLKKGFVRVEVAIDNRKGKRCFICGGLKKENESGSCFRHHRHYYGKLKRR